MNEFISVKDFWVKGEENPLIQEEAIPFLDTLNHYEPKTLHIKKTIISENQTIKSIFPIHLEDQTISSKNKYTNEQKENSDEFFNNDENKRSSECSEQQNLEQLEQTEENINYEVIDKTEVNIGENNKTLKDIEENNKTLKDIEENNKTLKDIEENNSKTEVNTNENNDNIEDSSNEQNNALFEEKILKELHQKEVDLQKKEEEYEKKLADLDFLKNEYATSIEKLDSTIRNIHQEYEEKFINLFESLSQYIFQAETILNQKYILKFIKEGIDTLGVLSGFLIKVNRSDYDYLLSKTDFKEQMNEKHIKLEISKDIKLGGCILESIEGKVDNTIDTKLETVKNLLIKELKQEKDVK